MSLAWGEEKKAQKTGICCGEESSSFAFCNTEVGKKPGFSCKSLRSSSKLFISLGKMG